MVVIEQLPTSPSNTSTRRTLGPKQLGQRDCRKWVYQLYGIPNYAAGDEVSDEGTYTREFIG